MNCCGFNKTQLFFYDYKNPCINVVEKMSKANGDTEIVTKHFKSIMVTITAMNYNKPHYYQFVSLKINKINADELLGRRNG